MGFSIKNENTPNRVRPLFVVIRPASFSRRVCGFEVKKKRSGNYLSLRDISIGVVRSEAFMILFPEARLGLAISLAGAAVGAGFFFYYSRKRSRSSHKVIRYIGLSSYSHCSIQPPLNKSSQEQRIRHHERTRNNRKEGPLTGTTSSSSDDSSSESLASDDSSAEESSSDSSLSRY